RRHTRWPRDWSSDVCSSDLVFLPMMNLVGQNAHPLRLIGVSTSTINYLRSLGQTVGLAIVGTVVTRTINTELHLPATTRQLPARSEERRVGKEGRSRRSQYR